MSSTKCVTLEEEMRKNPELKISDIEILREWCKKQPHLPKISNLHLAVMLHSNYYQIEPTKSTIENYFTIRTHTPEIFSNRDLRIKELRTSKVVGYAIGEETKKGYSMIVSRFLDFEPSHYNFADELNTVAMLLEEHIYTRGLIPGFICIIDGTGFSLEHLGRIHPVILKTAFIYVQKALPLRLKAVHFINSSPAIEVLYNMFKSLLNKELLELIHIHSSIEKAKNYFSVEALPDECGGKAGPIAELREASVQKIEDFREWFLEDENFSRVNESMRIGKSKTYNNLFGVDGCFKKLELD